MRTTLCSPILWNDNGLAVISARTMDWPESTQPVLTVLPRGMKRDGGIADDQVIVKDNLARWTSKYGSMVTTVYGIGTAPVEQLRPDGGTDRLSPWPERSCRTG
jgi:choloylglycine hydrolase